MGLSLPEVLPCHSFMRAGAVEKEGSIDQYFGKALATKDMR